MEAIILARVSTDIQTLESQINKLIEEANRMGYDKDHITIISGKESGVKLDIEERQTIQQLKELIETGRYNMVLIWEVSRLARRPKVLYEVREYLIDHHVNLRCMTPSFTMLKSDGTIDPTASIVFALFGTMAEEEARLTKERMARGKRHKQSLGGNIGGRPLFGYKFENDQLMIDYNKSKIVKRCYNLYEEGYSTRSIAIEMIQTGELKTSILNNANREVQLILTRPEYYGGTSKFSNYNYPPIITKEQYDKCREIAKNKSKEHTRVKQITLCKRLLYCKDNGYILTPNIRTGQYRLYTIDKKYNMTIKIDIIDKLIWDLVVEHAKKYDNHSGDKKQIEHEAYMALRKVQQAYRNIKDYEKQIDRIENRIIEGKMSETKGDKMINEKRILIKDCKEMIEHQNYIYGNKRQMLEEKSYIIDYSEIDDIVEKQKIVRKFVYKIMLEKTGIKRGHYLIEVHMSNDIIYKYYYWSSGPWNNVQRV